MSDPSSPAAPPAPFTVRAFREGDEAQILDLFHRCFHPGRTLAHWRWEYRGGPYGEAPISVAEGAGGRLVAHYAGYPVRFSLSGDGAARTLTAFHVGDTMTALEVRKVGRGPTSLLARTAAHFYDQWCERRVDFNYGFNAGNIQRFSVLFLGLRVLEPVPYRVRRLDGAPLEHLGHLSGLPPHTPDPSVNLRGGLGGGERPQPLATTPFQALSLGASRLAGYRVERIAGIDAVDARFDELFDRVRDAYGFLVERDARYLRWRYLASPDVEYAVYAVTRLRLGLGWPLRLPWFRERGLVGWGVFRRHGDRLVWGDALFDPRHPRAVRRLLSGVLADPAHRGTRAIEGWFPARPAWWGAILDKLGFLAEPEPQDLRLAYVPFSSDPGEELTSRLYYTKGDGDLF